MANKNNKVVKAVKVEEAKAPLIQKAPKTIIEGGLSYSLVSRLLNAMNEETRTKASAGDQVSLVDGRGQTQEVSSLAVELAKSLGAKMLSSVKSAYLRPRLVVNFDTKKVTLDESLVKVPFIKTKKEG